MKIKELMGGMILFSVIFALLFTFFDKEHFWQYII